MPLCFSRYCKLTVTHLIYRQNAKAFLAARLPIPLTAEEESKSAAGAPGAIIYPYTLLRMIRPNVARCVVETGMVVVYHCMDNSRYVRTDVRHMSHPQEKGSNYVLNDVIGC